MIQIPTIEMSDKKRMIILIIILLVFIGLMVFEYVRTENYKKEIIDKCINNDNRICICSEDLSLSNGLFQIIE